MGTRSRIGLLITETGRVESVYCHWDGYLSHNGKILLKSWSDASLLREMMEEGDMSTLGKVLGVKHDFDERQEGNYCTFYGRDRGEENVGKRTDPDVPTWLEAGEEYNYLFDPSTGRWRVWSYSERGLGKDLAVALAEEENDTSFPGAYP